jgi:hypothetical protein
MRLSLMAVVSLMITVLGACPVRADPYWPKGKEWATVTPKAAKMDEDKLATSPSQKMNPDYGFLWWLNANEGSRTRPARRSFAGLPKDLIAAMGREGQYVLVVPSLDLVVIRQGEQAGEAAFAKELLERVIGSIK